MLLLLFTLGFTEEDEDDEEGAASLFLVSFPSERHVNSTFDCVNGHHHCPQASCTVSFLIYSYVLDLMRICTIFISTLTPLTKHPALSPA